MSQFPVVMEIHASKVLPSHHTMSLSLTHRSLTQPNGRESAGRSLFQRIVHRKWPVQCANLMSSFLIAMEFHASKVLPSHPSMYLSFIHGSLAGPDGRESEGWTLDQWKAHEKWPVQCANLMTSFLIVREIRP